jgi:hypothetical protein
MIVMEHEEPIPCADCRLWNAKEKKFSCKPKDCKELSAWLLQYAPQLSAEKAQMQVQLPETAIQYVV